MKLKKQIPNMLTTVRIIGSLCLLFLPVLSTEFIIMYIVTGISDMLDGFFARTLHAESKFGERYDSVSDLLFVIVCFIKIFPILHLNIWVWFWIGLIALIRLFNIICGYRMYHKMIMLHTIANKVTGFLLFISPIISLWISFNIIAIVICVIATFTAVQEGHFIRTGRLSS